MLWETTFGGSYGGNGRGVFHDGAWVSQLGDEEQEEEEELGDWAGEDIALGKNGTALVAVDNGQFGFVLLKL